MWFCLTSIKFPRGSHPPLVWSLPLVLALLLPYYYGHVKLTCDFLSQPLGLPYMKSLPPSHPRSCNFYPLILVIYLPVLLFVLLSFVSLFSSSPPFSTLLSAPGDSDLRGLNQLLADGAPSKDRTFRVFTLLVASLQDRLKLGCVPPSKITDPLKVTFSTKRFCVPPSGFC